MRVLSGGIEKWPERRISDGSVLELLPANPTTAVGFLRFLLVGFYRRCGARFGEGFSSGVPRRFLPEISAEDSQNRPGY
jgi:hypothetical protein